ncbi:hypothetical protein LguiB_005641 [Lonicera macranthoides]
MKSTCSTSSISNSGSLARISSLSFTKIILASMAALEIPCSPPHLISEFFSNSSSSTAAMLLNSPAKAGLPTTLSSKQRNIVSFVPRVHFLRLAVSASKFIISN